MFNWRASLVSQLVKNLPASAGDTREMGLIPGLGRSPGEGNGYTLQYSCLKNSWTKELGWLQSMGFQRVGHDWATNTLTILKKIIQAILYFYLLILAIPLGQWTPGSSYHGMHRYSFLRHNCQYNFGAINNSVIKAVYAHMPIRIAMVAMPS